MSIEPALRKVNDEVFYLEENPILMGSQEVNLLKEKVAASERKRIRFCAHQSVEDPVHEMFVTLTKESYVRPHKHLSKSESFHIIEGSVELILFDEAGDIVNVIPLAERSSGGRFYFRFTEPSYHTLRVTSDLLTFHETTNGPFKKTDTVFAPWSPDDHDQRAVQKFMETLSVSIESKGGAR